MRVKGGHVTRQRRNSVKRMASGSWGTRHTSYKVAKQTVIRASQYAFRDRKVRRREFRKLWISRINAAVKPFGVNYSQFMNYLKKNNILLNRKMLSEMAINEPETFAKLVKKVVIEK